MPALSAIQATLSVPRIATYLSATHSDPPLHGAIELYAWNAQISAAFMHPLHLCEVVVRNAISEALSAAYGKQWPWNNGFLLSLPSPAGRGAFNPRNAVLSATAKAQISANAGSNLSTDKAIAEMSFAFWESMLTKRHDSGLWATHLLRLFPNTAADTPYFTVRAHIHSYLGTLRRLRNRIAHHEPIFARDLQAEFVMIDELIRLRCRATAEWMLATQDVLRLLATKPPL
jgi:hypothetical protein